MRRDTVGEGTREIELSQFLKVRLFAHIKNKSICQSVLIEYLGNLSIK